MNDELKELIQEARRKLRRASGVPLTAEEEAKEQQLRDIQAMEMFMFSAFGVRLSMKLHLTTVCIDGVVAEEMKVDGQTFHMRKSQEQYVLFAVKGRVDAEIVHITESDPEFASRVLVAIGDYLSPTLG